MSATTVDFIVVGAGIAGMSAAYELAKMGTVAVLEQEPHAAYHATGRSAAIFVESYGGPNLRALSVASRAFLEAPDAPHSDGSLLKRRRGLIYLARVAEESLLCDQNRYDPKKLTRLDVSDITALVPIIDPHAVSAALLEPSAADIDVHGLQQLYTRGLAARGGQVHFDAKLSSAIRIGQSWRVDIGAVRLQAPVIVNAAGPWAGEVGALLGAADYGLLPYRRSAALVDVPPPFAADEWPMVVDAAETIYFKPDAGRLMLSPADETASPPCDAMPDDLDIAVAVDRFESLTTISVKRVSHSWAGLRTFTPDRMPIIGFDPEVAGLFWLAGQGGVGVQTAPAVARIAAALASGTSLPGDLASAAIVPDLYSPRRLRADDVR